LIHRAVQFLIQYLPKETSETDKQQFPFPQSTVPANDDSVVINETGCARTEGFAGRKPFDMFGWLASKHRKPLEKLTTYVRKHIMFRVKKLKIYFAFEGLTNHGKTMVYQWLFVSAQ